MSLRRLSAGGALHKKRVDVEPKKNAGDLFEIEQIPHYKTSALFLA